MTPFPYKAYDVSQTTTFLVIGESREYPNCQIVRAYDEISGHNVFCWDMTEGSVFNRTYHQTDVKAINKYLDQAK